MSTDELDKKIVETFEKRFSTVLPTEVIDLALIENMNWYISKIQRFLFIYKYELIYIKNSKILIYL